MTYGIVLAMIFLATFSIGYGIVIFIVLKIGR